MHKAIFVAAFALPLAVPAVGQDTQSAPTSTEGTVFDGDWLSVGVGGVYSPSYDGSDDYVFSPLPLVQGSVGGVSIDPRVGGLALDFVPDPATGAGLDLGVTGRVRFSRSRQIEDPVVESLGERDVAIEVGPTAGINFRQVLNPYDSLNFAVDARWDVAGAHGGMVIEPGMTYATPLSRALLASLILGAEYVDNDYADYYYSVDAAGSAVSGLPAFDVGSGFTRASATLLIGYDLSGDVTDGGLALFGIGGYARMLGDAKDTPLTSIRGDADQWFVGAGIGFTF